MRSISSIRLRVARQFFCRSLRDVLSISASLRSRLLTINMSSSDTRLSHALACTGREETGTSNGKKYTICVEGNIGSGKTTLLKHFVNHPGVQTLEEPVNLWRNVRGHNVLAEMYKDPSRWSMALQTYIQLTMLANHTAPQTEPVRMMERSIHSARYCFVENLHKTGVLPDMEYIILDEWYQWIQRSQDIHADMIIYLHATPEICQERIKNRSRSEETSISLELLENLHTLHEDWLTHKRFPCQSNVLCIDANGDMSSMSEKYRELEDTIMGKIRAS